MKKRMISLVLAMVLALSLAISASAAEPAEFELSSTKDCLIGMVEHLFANETTSHVFSPDGTEITDAFIAQHQANYDAGNFSAITEDFLERGLFASYQSFGEGITPYLTVNYNGTTHLIGSFFYYDKKYTYDVTVNVKGTVHDYNFHFQSLKYATVTKFTCDLTSANLYKFEPFGLKLDAYTGLQSVKIGISYGGHAFQHQWRLTANAKTGALHAYTTP